MSAKWKKRLDPQAVLRRLKEIAHVSSDGTVSYSGFDYYDVMSTLQNMVEFPSNLDLLEKDRIVRRAVNDAAKKQALEPAKVLAEINALVKAALSEALSKSETEYRLLTSMSIRAPFPARATVVDDCRILVMEGGYPRKYSGRPERFLEQGSHIEGCPNGYAKVVVEVKARSERQAGPKALRALDLLRGVWCLLGNASMELSGKEWDPINKIRLGAAHTVHARDGEAFPDMFWYEPNFVAATPFSPSGIDIFRKNAGRILRWLARSPYSGELKDALLRFVRALDERDQNVALLKLWGALETLACPGDARYDLVVRRCSYLFRDRDFHRQVLEHLRDYRNRSVHAGDQSERVKPLCYRIQHYFCELFLFHVTNTGKFANLDAANAFLDMPDELEELKSRKTLAEAAIRFRFGTKPESRQG